GVDRAAKIQGYADAGAVHPGRLVVAAPLVEQHALEGVVLCGAWTQIDCCTIVRDDGDPAEVGVVGCWRRNCRGDRVVDRGVGVVGGARVRVVVCPGVVEHHAGASDGLAFESNPAAGNHINPRLEGRGVAVDAYRLVNTRDKGDVGTAGGAYVL